MKLLGGFRKDVCSFLVGKHLGEEWFGPIIQVRLTLRYLQTGKWIMRFYIPTSSECGESNGTQLQHSCLKNPMDGGAWWAAVHGVAKSRTQLSDFPFFFFFLLPIHFSLSGNGEGNGNPLQCSCLENPRDGEPGGLPFMGSHRVGHD